MFVKGHQAAALRALIPALLSTLLLIAARAQAQTETVLYNFCSVGFDCTDGAGPISILTPDGAGNFFGTTHSGGHSGTYGAVFELSPNGSGGWNESVIYNFSLGRQGAYPEFSPVVFDAAGNLYGTTEAGGIGYGVVFELMPIGQNWLEKVIYTFNNTGDGGSPQSGVIVDSAGNVYGTTPTGGPGNVGTVFELSASEGHWSEQVIYAFDTSLDAGPPGLTMDSNGNIFGAANLTVFELSPNGAGGWSPTTLHTFPGQDVGIDGTPALDKAGNVYGTIMLKEPDGTLGPGEVYKLQRENGKWGIESLHAWPDGTGPYAGVTLDAAGNVYGTTMDGGARGQGTVFELMPVHNTIKSYIQRVLWNFSGPDGANPLSSLVLDGSGNLYGATVFGGSVGYGTVFEVTP